MRDNRWDASLHTTSKLLRRDDDIWKLCLGGFSLDSSSDPRICMVWCIFTEYDYERGITCAISGVECISRTELVAHTRSDMN